MSWQRYVQDGFIITFTHSAFWSSLLEQQTLGITNIRYPSPCSCRHYFCFSSKNVSVALRSDGMRPQSHPLSGMKPACFCCVAGRPFEVCEGDEERVLRDSVHMTSPSGMQISLHEHLKQAGRTMGGSELMGQRLWIFWFDEDALRSKLRSKGKWFHAIITGKSLL